MALLTAAARLLGAKVSLKEEARPGARGGAEATAGPPAPALPPTPQRSPPRLKGARPWRAASPSRSS